MRCINKCATMWAEYSEVYGTMFWNFGYIVTVHLSENGMHFTNTFYMFRCNYISCDVLFPCLRGYNYIFLPH